MNASLQLCVGGASFKLHNATVDFLAEFTEGTDTNVLHSVLDSADQVRDELVARATILHRR